MGARLDQHYLVSETIRDSIIAAARLRDRDAVIEIGPGRGILTGELITRAADLTAIEMDDRLAKGLEEKYGDSPGFTLLHSDFLKVDLSSLGRGPYKIVANLPYAVATPILQRLLDWSGWTVAVLMFQKEVAERIVAVPGSRDYGVLTLSVNLKASAERLFDAAPDDFRPRPKVESSVVRFTRLPEARLGAVEEKAFFRVVKAAFGQRRKMAAKLIAKNLGLPREKVSAALESMGVSPRCRAEEIPFEVFLKLSQSL